MASALCGNLNDMFAHLFDSDELSDTLLEFATPHDGVVIRSYRAHAVLLATASPVLNAHILRWCGSVDDHGCRTVRISVNADEVHAAEDVMRCIYSGAHSEEGWGLRHRFSMFIIADRIGVAQVRDTILASAKPTSVDDVNFVCSQSQWTHADVVALRTATDQHVLEVFGHVPNMLLEHDDEDGTGRLSMFCELCFDAVCKFARSDLMRVCSENDVVVLLSAWIRSNQCTAAQLNTLTSALRPMHLSATYFVNLAALAPWTTFGASKAALQTYYRIMGHDGDTPRRQQQLAGVRITLPVGQPDLLRLFAAKSSAWYPNTSYYYGYFWQIGMELARLGDDQFVLSMCVRAVLPDTMLLPGANADMPYISCRLISKLGEDGRTEQCISETSSTHTVQIGSIIKTVAVPVHGIGCMAPFMDADGNTPMFIDVRMCD